MDTDTPEVAEQRGDEPFEIDWDLVELRVQELREVAGGQSTVAVVD